MAYASCVFVSWGVASGNLSEFPLQNYQHGANDSVCEGKGGGGVYMHGGEVGGMDESIGMWEGSM